MIIHYNCTIGSIFLHFFLLICHPYPSSFHEMIFILVYIEPATISLISSPSSSIMAGDTVTLTCSLTLPHGVTGTPDFQWEGPGGVTLTPADSMTSGQTVSSDLPLNEITTSQAGQYTCTATLRGSINTSTTITVESEFSRALSSMITFAHTLSPSPNSRDHC